MRKILLLLFLLVSVFINAQDITVYGTNTCGYTTSLRNQLTDTKIPFTYSNIETMTVQQWNDFMKFVYDFNLAVNGSVDLPVVKVVIYGKIYAYVRPTLQMITKLTGVVDIDNEISIFPNPVDHILYIMGTNKPVRIYDLSGRLVLDTRDREIDMSRFPSGGYIMRIANIKILTILKR